MDISRAAFVLPVDRMRPGDVTKIERGSLYKEITKKQDELIRTDTDASSLTISQVGRAVACLLKEARVDAAASSASFSDFISSIHRSVVAEGTDARVFRELPVSGTVERLALAKQAGNCLSVSYYGGEKLHAGISAKNPFGSMDRLSLSQIAFDDSGTFTSVERQVAYLEMSDRDSSFRSEVYDVASKLGGNQKAPWHDIASCLADGQISSAMSDAERAWQGWEGAEGLLASAASLLQKFGLEMPSLPIYRNLKVSAGSVLAATAGADSKAVWKCIQVMHLPSVEPRISLASLITLIREPRDFTASHETSVRGIFRCPVSANL